MSFRKVRVRRYDRREAVEEGRHAGSTHRTSRASDKHVPCPNTGVRACRASIALHRGYLDRITIVGAIRRSTGTPGNAPWNALGLPESQAETGTWRSVERGNASLGGGH